MEIKELHQRFLSSKGICTDTRKLESETIFFALKGDNFNGNEYASQAIEAGCSLAIIDEAQHATSDKCVLVDSVLSTLQQLANYHRKQFDIPVLGITGSNGKTTTKELIGEVLSKKFNLLITQGNLNNHLGVPFTLLRLTTDHDFAVIEMGASKPGDIQELVEIAEPTHGIITNIGAAHIEGFGSIEGVIRTKTEMYRYLAKESGFVFYNGDDQTLAEHLPETKSMSYGEFKGVVKGKLVSLDPFITFSWSDSDYDSPPIKTNLVGKYNFTNFLAAVAIGRYFEVAEKKIDQALTAYVPSNNRSQVQKTERNTLIVDCYNANPTSMKAAIESFSEVEGESKLAILGDMLELGDISQDEHEKIIAQLESLGIQALLVGTEFQKAQTKFPQYANYQELMEKEKLSSIENSLILLKGSRGIRLENLIPEL